jgi:hypothetical protein
MNKLSELKKLIRGRVPDNINWVQQYNITIEIIEELLLNYVDDHTEIFWPDVVSELALRARTSDDISEDRNGVLQSLRLVKNESAFVYRTRMAHAISVLNHIQERIGARIGVKSLEKINALISDLEMKT